MASLLVDLLVVLLGSGGDDNGGRISIGSRIIGLVREPGGVVSMQALVSRAHKRAPRHISAGGHSVLMELSHSVSVCLGKTVIV